MLLKKIVVAEDDDAIAHMVSMALGDAGYLCIRARDGEEALQITKMHQPDLLVLDVMMPKLDGRMVAAKLKEDVLLSKVPILMLTALADVESKVQGLDAGADDYMSKPFDLREFSARVRALVRAAKRERDRNATTDLPGSVGIDEHIQGILAGDDDQAIMQLGVSGFSALSARLGHSASVDFIKSLASFILTELRSQEGGFLGHLGGTDFIGACSAAQSKSFMSSVLKGFDEKRASWSGQASPELSLVIGMVSSADVDDDEVLAKRLAAATGKARAAGGSNYVISTEST